MDEAIVTPVALLGTQVVAGVSDCILAQVTPAPDADPLWKLIYIYVDLRGTSG
ncbi:MAG: hypothetical protein IJ083_01985 [Clostridia bacterium]|nr:hypothetical protein [Clostridia bacterium]